MGSAVPDLRPFRRLVEWPVLPGTALLVVFVACTGGIEAHAQSEKDAMLVHFGDAQAALRRSDLDRAAVEYKDFLAEAIHRIANARAQTGDSSAADQDFNEALSFAKDDPLVRLDYASVLFDQGRLADARSMAQSALDSHPKNGRAETLLGRVSFQEGSYREAAAQLEAAAADGQFGEVWRLLALTYLRLQEPNRAQPVLAKALRMLGDTPPNRVLIATIYYYGDYPDRAIDELHTALAQNSRAPDAHYYLGLAYLGNNEAAAYAKAIPEFRAQLKATPGDFRSHYMLGYIALQQHQFQQAEPELSQAARLNPADAGTKLLLGQLYSETGRTQQATDILRSLTTAPANTSSVNFITIRAHYMLGRLLQQSSQPQEGASEIALAEKLRRELRASAVETHSSRTSTIVAEQRLNNAASQATSPSIHVDPEERARAQAFVQQLQPLIGEAYFNLARISVLHQDPVTASHYSARAVAWDPSLASRMGH